MPCLVCRSTNTVRAHLIPRCFVKQVVSEPGEKHIFAHSDSDSHKISNNGFYDTEILCGKCDSWIGRYENDAYNVLNAIRQTKQPAHSVLRQYPIDGDGFVRFASGIAWKFAATKPEFGKIKVGRYMDVLRRISFFEEEIPREIDVFAVFLQDGSSDVYFYRAPMTVRLSGINFVRFSAGGFVIFLKIDQRTPRFPVSDRWLKGKSKADFEIAPADSFEEWNMSMNIRKRPEIEAYFSRMRSQSPNKAI